MSFPPPLPLLPPPIPLLPPPPAPAVSLPAPPPPGAIARRPSASRPPRPRHGPPPAAVAGAAALRHAAHEPARALTPGPRVMAGAGPAPRCLPTQPWPLAGCLPRCGGMASGPPHGPGCRLGAQRPPGGGRGWRLHQPRELTAAASADALGAADLPPEDFGAAYEPPVEVFPRWRERNPYRWHRSVAPAQSPWWWIFHGHRNRDDGLPPQAPGRLARRFVRGGAGRQELPVRGVHATSAPHARDIYSGPQRDNLSCNCETTSSATAKCLWLSPQTYRAHERSRESIELAYDSILQQKMKVRHKYGFKPPKTGRKGDLDGDRSVSAGHALCCCYPLLSTSSVPCLRISATCSSPRGVGSQPRSLLGHIKESLEPSVPGTTLVNEGSIYLGLGLW